MGVKHPNIFLTGRNGQVGWELHRELSSLGRVFAFDHRDLDISQPDCVAKKLREISPEIIVNAAAYTAVDKAEEEPELARAVNGIAPGVIAEEAAHYGAIFIHYSTDYVFDGLKEGPYHEKDSPHPLNVYGITKLEGEKNALASGGKCFILRTSWVYGARGNNFLRTIIRLAKEKDEIRVVSDQQGVPNWCGDIAKATSQMIQKMMSEEGNSSSGIYHIASQGEASWFDFAKRIAEQRGFSTKITPTLTRNYPSRASRPSNSRLDSHKIRETFGIELPYWADSLTDVIKTVKLDEQSIP